MADEPELSADEWSRLAQWVRSELARRKQARSDREKVWKEVDRQIAMNPKYRAVNDREPNPMRPAWYPNIETPLQFNALEVISADVRRLTFPRIGPWYKVSAAITDEYRDRWDSRRLKKAIIGKIPLEMNLDQETADIIVKQTLEHFHRIYDFKSSIGLFDTERLKYGTGTIRVRQVKAARSAHEYRGQWSDKTIGPKVIPCTMWHTYLDDSWSAVLHEGEIIGPTIIRIIGSQPIEDLRQAAELGGSDDGWIVRNVNQLIGKMGEDGKSDTVELLEVEGDIVVPKSTSGSIYLPNVILTIAGQTQKDNAGVVRFRTNPMPFRSYVVGHYFKHDSRHAYGDSPLMKGVPLQEISTESTNDFLAGSRLKVLKPIAYDRTDPTLAAQGGPIIYPGAMWPADAPNALEPIDVGDPAAALNAALSMIKLHEDTTGANDARRGQRLKSHTTAGAAEIEASQGISRTDDFVTDSLAGPLTTVLHMEYEIAKDSMKTPQYIRIDAEGIEGWIKLASGDLADMVEFEPIGAEGIIEERQRARSFIEASTFVVTGLAPAAAQLGIPMTINFEAIGREAYERAGVNPSKFIGPANVIAEGAAAESVIPGIAANPEEAAAGQSAEALPPAGPNPNGPPNGGMGLPVGPM